MEIVFATNNKHKLEEVRAIAGNSFKILSLADIHCNDDIEESAETLEGNALLKASYVFDKFNIPCFSDDSGLEVEALNNAPGVYSARYGGEHGNHDKNIARLLNELQLYENRNARFRTVICYVDKKGIPTYFNGIIQGTITRERRGTNGFGYDPVFRPDGYEHTFAEMTADLKNKISHRAQAVDEFFRFLKR